MSLWSAELSQPFVVNDIHTPINLIALGRIFSRRAAFTPIQPGEEVDVTPELMRRERRHQITGYTYIAAAHKDEYETGTVAMISMSPIAQGIILGEEGKLYKAVGPYTFSLGPRDLRRLYVAHYTLQRETVIPSAVIWKPSK